MPDRITIECTECGAKLNLADKSKLGKKIKCPKCAEVFVAASDDEELDELDDEFAEDDEDERPRGKKGAGSATKAGASLKKGAAAKGGKKGKGKKSGSNLGLIIGGAVGAVVLLGGLVGGLFAAGVFGGKKVDPNQIVVSPQPGAGVFSSLLKEQGPTPVPPRGPIPEAAKWLPADTELVVHLRVADLLDSPLAKDVVKTMQLEKQLEQAAESLGWNPAEIESITVGIANLEQAQQQMQQAQMAMMMGRQGQPVALNVPALAVYKMKKSIKEEELHQVVERMSKGQTIEKLSHAGKNYLQSLTPGTPQQFGIWLASESLVVLGDSTSLKTALEKGANANPTPNFGFMDWTDHFSVAYAPSKPDALKRQISTGSQGNPMAAVAVAPLADGATGFSLGLTAKGGIDVEIAIGCVDAGKMDAIVKSLTDLAALGRGQYDQGKGQLPPWAAPLTEQLMGSLKVAGTNRVALITTGLPDSAKDQLVQLPNLLMTQFMMNALMPKPGAPGTPPSAPSEPTSPGDAPDGEPPVKEKK